MDDDDVVVPFVAAHVDDHRFARLGLIAAAATERSLLEHLPARCGHEQLLESKVASL